MISTALKISGSWLGWYVLLTIVSSGGCDGASAGQDNNNSHPWCGNGLQEAAEQCDGDDLAGESCESHGFAGGSLSCTTNCALDTTDCSSPPNCGDGQLDLDEDCDGASFGGQTCATLGYDGGDLLCTGQCRIDSAGCHRCGDGVINGVEECDGTAFGPADSCSSVAGHASGELACSAACTLDISACYTCGDGAIDGPELCDSQNLGGATCLALTGLTNGAPACQPGCLSFDTTGCYTCGNGIVEAAEACDGTDFGASTCLSESGHSDGTLSCSTNCTIDPSGCHVCGDGVISWPEVCDGTNLNGETCQSLTGFPFGEPTCSSCLAIDTQQCGNCGDGILDLTEECDDGNTTDWDGCTSCQITEFQVNTYSLEYQAVARVATTADGSFIVVWRSSIYDGRGGGIYGQLFAPSGVHVGGELKINTCDDGVQTSPDVATTPDGGFIVVWQSNDGATCNGIIGRRYHASGFPAGGEFQINTTTAPSHARPAVAVAPDGSYFVTFESWLQDGSKMGIYGRRFDAADQPLSGEFQVNTYTQDQQSVSRALFGPNGDLFVVWDSENQDGDRYGVYGQCFDASGAMAGNEYRINVTTTDSQCAPTIAPKPGGGFNVVWWSDGDQDGDGSGIFGRSFDSSCLATSSEWQINTYTADYQLYPVIAAAPDGRFVVVWESWYQDGSDASIFAQRFSSAGTFDGAEFQVNVFTPGSQQDPAIASRSDGSFVVVWTGTGDQDGYDSGIFAQRFDSNGNPLGVDP